MKTETTKSLEKLLDSYLIHRNIMHVFECTYGWAGHEIVDCAGYDFDREVYCFEIKQSVSDFHSKNKISFWGTKNYFVLTNDLYEKVKNDIWVEYPKAGVLIPNRVEKSSDGVGYISISDDFNSKETELVAVKSARKSTITGDREIILSSMLRSMERDLARGNRFPVNEQDNKHE